MMKTRKRFSARTKLLVFLLIACLFSGIAQAKDHLTLGIHPYKSPARLIESYTPLVKYLSRKMDMPVQVSISKDYQAHINAIGKDQLDIAYMGPASYISLVELYGNKPLLACQEIHGKSTFQGKIIIRKESPLHALSQLKGKSFAFGDPSSTMSHLVPRYMLWKDGVSAEQLGRYKFMGSHDNVALAVLSGEFDAGAVKEAVFYKYQARGLKALETTPALSEHLFVTSNKLDSATVDKLREAFLSLNEDPDGKRIMNSIKPGMTAMAPVEDKDYANLREILRTLKQIGVME
jgi:phosphonate transport system substrate-binding protein